ncbi:hypothetical protein RKD29_007619 [Streptomyces tendae]
MLEGTFLLIGRIAARQSFCSGKHLKRGMDVQFVANPSSRLLGASPALPGAAYDVGAAREHAIIDALAEAGTPAG